MNSIRNGNFTSSEIYALLSMGSRPMTKQELADYKKEYPKSQKKNIECWPGKAALTYIEECNMERRLGRSIEDESYARALTWGKLIEKRVFDLLTTEYRLCSQDTISHPYIDCWKGSPDAVKFDEGKTVCDIKSPFTLKSFVQLSDCKTPSELRDNHTEGEKYYWQLVSNAILTGASHAELIIYCPYRSELEDIRDMARAMDESISSKYIWINYASDDELPWIHDGGHYKNINIIRFDVPESDKKILHDRVVLASKLLKNYEKKEHHTTPVV